MVIPRLLLILAALYLVLCAALYLGQRRLIYFPPQHRARSDVPVEVLERNGARVLVSTRRVEGPRAVLYFGGNAEDVSLSIDDVARAFDDASVYAMHYRGYGGSTGTPVERALASDATALFDRVAASHGHVTVVGRSLGSGIAVQLAAQRPVDRLVLVTPFDSIVDLGARQFPFVPVRWLLRDRYESWRHAPQVRAPVTLVVAQHDEVIPAASSARLARAFRPGQAVVVVVPGAGHNDLSLAAVYEAALRGDR